MSPLAQILSSTASALRPAWAALIVGALAVLGLALAVTRRTGPR